ncbi:RhoGAP-domain-containing protein [Coemansia reversa NRRL 1564]|uniref:RhoGAP-domain-containing protein n=1 Tax=Coemansia reversa (strain ATCC 12441 / NRRL 1564) TaxID=763665 RepID=A0A2G5B8I2_COERN|nr:RhoGAP-domain-containing protein [Coemansia reversa NRRL 1564]|eukprot:PIA15343.1 RhoGAP-domain-containing protein [Coemansia reversa NRRL 1564]
MTTREEFPGEFPPYATTDSDGASAVTDITNGLHSQTTTTTEQHTQGSIGTGSQQAAQVDLTEIDGGLAMLLERSRQSLGSCKEAVVFLRSRAKIEEDYGRSLQKVAQQTLKMMDNGAKSATGISTQQAAWQRLVEVHETLASNRMKFSITLTEMSEYLGNYVKAKESVRRKLRETEQRYQKAIEESYVMLEKARVKYESNSVEWERLLVKGGNSKNVGSTVSGIFGKHKGSTQESLERLGQEAGVKAKVANEAYKRLLQQTNLMRRDFYDVQLPKILASVMGLVEEVEQFLKFTLGKYAYTYESAVLADAVTLKPVDGTSVGMVEMVGDIDSKADLDAYLQMTAKSGGRIDRGNIPYREYRMSTQAQLYASPKPIFGVPLDEQLCRDGQSVPLILVKCAEAVEARGLQNEGIYRHSGQSSQVKKLRSEFDLDAEYVDLNNSPYVKDINNVTGVLKMYLRELPDGPIPDAQRMSMLKYFSPDDSYSVVDQDELKLAQKISGLADAIRNMSEPYRNTVAFLFAHLDKVQAFQEYNMMSSKNLGIVFGPNVLPPSNDPASAAADSRTAGVMIKFILDNRRAIFEAV